MAREMKDSGIEWIDSIPKSWKTMKIKYSSWLKGRIGWQGLTASEYVDEGPYLVTGTDFQNGKVDWSRCAHITKERFEEDSDIHIKEGDLLITKDGTVGKVAIAKDCPNEVSLNSGIMLIRNTGKYQYSDKYLYYVLLSDEFWRWYTLTQAGQSTIKHLYQAQFYSFEYTYPSIKEQKAIADFLDTKCASIDIVIEKTRASIEEYKKLKRAIITQTVTKGFHPDRSMKDSGVDWIGDIPVEWEMTKVKYVAEFQPSCDSSNLTKDCEISYLPMEYIKNGYFINNTAKYSDVSSSLTPFNNGDIAIAKVTPCFENGNIAVMENLSSGFGLGSSELFILRPRSILTKYLFYWLQNDSFMQRGCSTMNGTGGLKRVSPYFMRNCPVTVPNDAEQKEIVAYLDHKTNEIDALIEKKEMYLSGLESLKKSLIFEYVTGKKEVPA